MSINEKTNSYTSHKHAFNVYVDLNTKTKLGQDLLGQYKEQSKNHYMDIGRIGYHDNYGRYVIDEYTRKELMVVPKIIIRVTQCAMDRAGKDVYQLRTYMSKFGQLNFLLLVDKDKADLMLVENIYIENLNHREDYETLIWRLSYINQKPTPLKEVFYKFGIRANPEDYGKGWKDEDVKINNLVVAKAKAEMTKQIANKIASSINQKALVASLNYLNKEGEYGKKITKAYSEKVAKKTEINKLATSPKLENTLNHVLVKTLEEQTTKKDLTNRDNFRVYKKVLDVQMSVPHTIASQINEVNDKQNLKKFIVESYQKPVKDVMPSNINEEEIFNKKQAEFEKIIDYKYQRKNNKENTILTEEVLNPKLVKPTCVLENFKDFDGKKVNVNLDCDRFEKPEEPHKKRQREKEEKQQIKQEKLSIKIKNKIKRGLKRLNAECDIDNELNKSKTIFGLSSEEDPKRKKKKKFSLFEFSNEEESKKKLTKEEKQQIKKEKAQKADEILSNLGSDVKKLNAKQEAKRQKQEIKEAKKQQKLKNKALKKDKESLFKEYLTKKKVKNKDKKKKKNLALEDVKPTKEKDNKKKKNLVDDYAPFRPVVKQAEKTKENSEGFNKAKDSNANPTKTAEKGKSFEPFENQQAEAKTLQNREEKPKQNNAKQEENTKKSIYDNALNKNSEIKPNLNALRQQDAPKQSMESQQHNGFKFQQESNNYQNQTFDITKNKMVNRKEKERTLEM